jgi:hypothetical protein
MVNIRMDDDTIEWLDKVGPTRSDAIRKCVSIVRREHKVATVQAELVSVSRLAGQRQAPDPDAPLSADLTQQQMVDDDGPVTTIRQEIADRYAEGVISRVQPLAGGVITDVPRGTIDSGVEMPPIDPPSAPTAEYLEMKEAALATEKASCRHPVTHRIGNGLCTLCGQTV